MSPGRLAAAPPAQAHLGQGSSSGKHRCFPPGPETLRLASLA